MIQVLLVFWILSAACIVFCRKVYRVIIYFGVFSLITSVIYLSLGAPDVAMSEAGISAFATIFFIVCVEKYYSRGRGLRREEALERQPRKLLFTKFIPPLMFTLLIGGLFLYFVPTGYVITELRDQYLQMFMVDVGGTNAVTAIYLGYRVYDTLFEALLLVVAVVAVTHVSWLGLDQIPDGRHSEIENSAMARFTMRIICPIILLFAAYLIMNGHISAGGGFLGGLTIASFFICRYLVLDIYDLPVKKVMKLEELVFINITIVPVLAIFTGVVYLVADVTPLFQHIYLIAMSSLVGMKVACGFFILFYRYVAIERL
ncbi:MAG: DUF4040 domain-containing protein [Defluviitaleaceae bacterium]|nr:DUF4040 domain-containing protein [Defluviitaleaceae bacterium]